MKRLDWWSDQERAKIEPLFQRAAAIVRQGEARSRRTLLSACRADRTETAVLRHHQLARNSRQKTAFRRHHMG